MESDAKSIKKYADEVRKKYEAEREFGREDRFLRTSLRSSDRLKALEKYRRVIHQDDPSKHPEVNLAFEDDSVSEPIRSELSELINYIRTKLPLTTDDKENKPRLGNDDLLIKNDIKSQTDEEIEQWEWLLKVLCDPDLSKSFLMHDCIAKSYEQCKQALDPLPRYRWPILGGLAYDTMESVRKQLTITVQGPINLDNSLINNISTILTYLSAPSIQNLLIAMDGLANTWFIDADEELDTDELIGMTNEDQSDLTSNPNVQQSVVTGCYSILAFDENGRDSYTEDGVRLKYVILQKGDNEFLGATVSVERNSVIIARIVNGGLAHKTDLLHEGDELLSVNGIDLMGKDLDAVCDIMASLHGKIVLLVAPSLDPYSRVPTKGIIHLRALFTYEPDEDRYLGCKELGLPFTKGDILHVTGRTDPNWWQAYRSDETSGLSGAIGTLAGLIPSPINQRNRAILRLKYWLSSGTEDIELENSSCSDSDTTTTSTTTSPSSLANLNHHKSKSFKTMKLFRRFNPNHSNQNNSHTDSVHNNDNNNKTADQSASNIDLHENQLSPEEKSRCVMNRSLITSIYGDRISGLTRSDSNSSHAIDEWSAAGPVWGQHGYDLRTLRSRHKRSGHRKSSVSKTSPCLDGLKSWRKNKNIMEYFPSVINVPSSDAQSGDDPVAWLDKEIARGFMIHPSLWTYEPVLQYIPEPLRRRPLVFVGPAHVGRHQIMQSLIKSGLGRFESAAIHTTNKNFKTDNNQTEYLCITEEEFRAKRDQGEFIEWGMFNRSYYGTSKLTVKLLADSGKICCMSLRPDSLKVMRSTGLMPYVIFISPPERVDDLDCIRRKMNLVGNCSTEELRACIETSRKMELRFGHWFDKVIIPETVESTVEQIFQITLRLERELNWVPRYWLK